MEKDLLAAEEACSDDSLKPRTALSIVQSLRRHEETLRAASSRRILDSAKGAVSSQPRATPWVTVADRKVEG
jgi:hypothetical protein